MGEESKVRKIKPIRELRKICGKEYPLLHRPIAFVAVYITKLLLYTRITANQVTLLNIFVGIIAGGFFIYGHNWSMLVGALLWCLHLLLDFVDGQVARYRGTAGLTGAYFDRMADQIVEFYVFLTISFGLYSTFHDVAILAFGFLAAMSSLPSRGFPADLIYICAVEARLHYLETNTQPKEALEIGELNPEETKNLHRASASRLPIISIIYNIYTHMPMYTVHLMFLVAAIIDMIIGPWTTGSFDFDSVYICLCLWGVLTPLSWLSWSAIAWVAVRNKSTERLYAKLFSRPDQGGV